MTQQYGPPVTAPRRRIDIPGLIAVILAGVVLLPTVLVFLVGLIPEMNAIWWLGIVLIPILGFVGVVVAILGVVGIVLGARGRTRYVLSIIGVVLGIVMLVPIGYLWVSSLG